MISMCTCVTTGKDRNVVDGMEAWKAECKLFEELMRTVETYSGKMTASQPMVVDCLPQKPVFKGSAKEVKERKSPQHPGEENYICIFKSAPADCMGREVVTPRCSLTPSHQL